jgi:type 1 fimbria pilin
MTEDTRMKESVTRRRRAGCGLVGLLLLSPLVEAAPSSTLTVKVTVVAPPPCIINGDRPIEVDFNDVMTTRVDGNTYRMPVNYTLSCPAGAPSNAMKLQVRGTGADFDAKVLKTTQPGLGVQLQEKDRSKISINTWRNFDYVGSTGPELWAVPVKQSGMTLTGGEFTAAATMEVAYQ